MNTRLFQKQGEKGGLRMHRWLLVYCDGPGAHPSLSQAKAPAPLTSHCSSTLEQWLPGPKKELSGETQRGLR